MVKDKKNKIVNPHKFGIDENRKMVIGLLLKEILDKDIIVTDKIYSLYEKIGYSQLCAPLVHGYLKQGMNVLQICNKLHLDKKAVLYIKYEK